MLPMTDPIKEQTLTARSFPGLIALWKQDAPSFQRLLILAMPIAAQNLVQTLLNMVDTLMIGQLGERAIAAVALSNQVFFFTHAAALRNQQRICGVHSPVLGKKRPSRNPQCPGNGSDPRICRSSPLYSSGPAGTGFYPWNILNRRRGHQSRHPLSEDRFGELSVHRRKPSYFREFSGVRESSGCPSYSRYQP